MSKPKGGARKGAGRPSKLSFEQKLWLKRRYEELMHDRAKERAIQKLISSKNDKEDDEYSDDESLLDELRKYQAELRALPISERQGREAKLLQSLSAAIIGKQRFVRVGTGRGPLLKTGIEEKAARDIREQVANEANKNWGRNDVTDRDVKAACEEKFTDLDIVENWLDKK